MRNDLNAQASQDNTKLLWEVFCNGQEFKKCIEDLPNKPDAICIQETWLKINLDFKIAGYTRDREEGIGGGCVTFIKEDYLFREIEVIRSI